MLSPKQQSSSPAPASPTSTQRRRGSVQGSPEASGPEQENVHVICRIRPFNAREVEIHNEANESLSEYERYPIRSVVEFDGPQCIFLDSKTWQEKERFAFDQCYWSIPDEIQKCEQSPFAGQSALYEGFGRAMLTQAWKGYNTCFFAYGQTGSGKTYSMMGNPESNDPGLIPRVCQQLFKDIEHMQQESLQHKDSYVMQFRAEVRYIEIYNEHVSDLLWSLSTLPPELKAKCNFENMRVRSSPATGVFIEHLTAIEVTSWDDMLRLINLGNSCRHTAATKMNERSSRSHAIFKVTLSQVTTSVPKKQFEKPTEHLRESVINLIDLAGSERNKKTGATGDRLKEAASINKSLSCLKSVIDVLVENSTKGAKKRPPYRDSTLTSLLMDSLGGNSKTFMLVCISPHSDNSDETLQTLRYGSRARQIVHVVHVNENASGRMLLELEDELEKMKKELERAANSAQPESIEALKTQIEEQEQLMSAYEAQIDEQTDRIQRMREAKEKEMRARQAFAATNLSTLAKHRSRREESRMEYLRLRERLQLLRSDREAMEIDRETNERREHDLREAIESHKHRSAELEQECETWRKKVAKLDMYRRELEDNVAEQQATLARQRMDKHGAILRARYRCAQIRLEAKAEIQELQTKHDSEVAALTKDADSERERIIAAEHEKERVIEEENEKLRQELAFIRAETARIQTERGSQIAQLEEELRLLQAEHRRKTQENSERVENAKREWAESFARMEAEMKARHEAAEAEWTRKHAEAADNERRQFEERTAAWNQQLNESRAHWDAQVSSAEKDCETECNLAKAEWDAKIGKAMEVNKGLRQRLRAVEARERDCAVMMRRVTAVMESNPKPSPSNSDEYRALHSLLLDFQAEYELSAPSLYRLQHLLRDDFNQTRCEQAPLVGVPEEAQPARLRDPPPDDEHADRPAIRLRPRSPRRA